ncbi:hypothetical protein VOLCADRAFT_90551 [Volvox carteri f. nagariensis]|uniref:Uncharacterized protein n=1 Tax=Volvox carteri f. nagariensis TaxID=3068 RepID=D8TUP8_VOLCA|nr:uncharacterized protein VOLCADRAFT_90551 [Volvox carteri f. nagariensis]EFJ48746.1 hypothetical protein VOLCADRAFT_90551 [Volvox carteri f. nagariensis]|eukprot:XP_002950078.1 hypothetical protein VOLCADRAFT_90551 [Volvox carteri f. nagariensis]
MHECGTMNTTKIRQEQREEHEHAAREAPSERGELESHAAAAGGGGDNAVAAAADGSGDSLYGPEGLNATAPDISRREGEGEGEVRLQGEGGGGHGGDSGGGGGGLGDVIRGTQERISQEAQQLKDRFQEGYREAHDRAVAPSEEGELPRGTDTATWERPRGNAGGGDEGSLEETLRAAKARIAEENELLKERFREGYQQAQSKGGVSPPYGGSVRRDSDCRGLSDSKGPPRKHRFKAVQDEPCEPAPLGRGGRA